MAVFEESEGPGVEASQVLPKTCWGLSRGSLQQALLKEELAWRRWDWNPARRIWSISDAWSEKSLRREGWEGQ
jgi:hypothetical protein